MPLFPLLGVEPTPYFRGGLVQHRLGIAPFVRGRRRYAGVPLDDLPGDGGLTFVSEEVVECLADKCRARDASPCRLPIEEVQELGSELHDRLHASHMVTIW